MPICNNCGAYYSEATCPTCWREARLNEILQTVLQEIRESSNKSLKAEKIAKHIPIKSARDYCCICNKEIKLPEFSAYKLCKECGTPFISYVSGIRLEDIKGDKWYLIFLFLLLNPQIIPKTFSALLGNHVFLGEDLNGLKFQVENGKVFWFDINEQMFKMPLFEYNLENIALGTIKVEGIIDLKERLSSGRIPKVTITGKYFLNTEFKYENSLGMCHTLDSKLIPLNLNHVQVYTSDGQMQNITSGRNVSDDFHDFYMRFSFLFPSKDEKNCFSRMIFILWLLYEYLSDAFTNPKVFAFLELLNVLQKKGLKDIIRRNTDFFEDFKGALKYTLFHVQWFENVKHENVRSKAVDELNRARRILHFYLPEISKISRNTFRLVATNLQTLFLNEFQSIGVECLQQCVFESFLEGITKNYESVNSFFEYLMLLRKKNNFNALIELFYNYLQQFDTLQQVPPPYIIFLAQPFIEAIEEISVDRILFYWHPSDFLKLLERTSDPALSKAIGVILKRYFTTYYQSLSQETFERFLSCQRKLGTIKNLLDIDFFPVDSIMVQLKGLVSANDLNEHQVELIGLLVENLAQKEVFFPIEIPQHLLRHLFASKNTMVAFRLAILLKQFFPEILSTISDVALSELIIAHPNVKFFETLLNMGFFTSTSVIKALKHLISENIREPELITFRKNLLKPVVKQKVPFVAHLSPENVLTIIKDYNEPDIFFYCLAEMVKTNRTEINDLLRHDVIKSKFQKMCRIARYQRYLPYVDQLIMELEKKPHKSYYSFYKAHAEDLRYKILHEPFDEIMKEGGLVKIIQHITSNSVSKEIHLRRLDHIPFEILLEIVEKIHVVWTFHLFRIIAEYQLAILPELNEYLTWDVIQDLAKRSQGADDVALFMKALKCMNNPHLEKLFELYPPDRLEDMKPSFYFDESYERATLVRLKHAGYLDYWEKKKQQEQQELRTINRRRRRRQSD